MARNDSTGIVSSSGGISAVRELVQNFSANNKARITTIGDKAPRLIEACHEVDRAWSGSYIGHHGSYYYGKLTPPPPERRWSIEWGTVHGVPEGWNAWEGGDIRRVIEERVGEDFSVTGFAQEGEKLLKEAKKLKTDIEIEMSDFDFSSGMEKEQELFSAVEEFSFIDPEQAAADFINSRVPKTKMSRDSEALMEGTYIPSHVTSEANARINQDILQSVISFLELVDRLTRQTEKKLGSPRRSILSISAPPEPLSKLIKILERFHGVAQQLQKRHGGRPTLEINDEYDVQDLLHALLKSEFDDVREEEWTPSYAGSSTRMDFLLKKEEIVTEVKRTNASLKDKQLGEQLILDIAHYKVHKNCKTLLCFVYDPAYLLKNRAGLIADLQSDHDGLQVIVVICP